MRLVNLSCDGDQAWAFGSSLYSYLNLVMVTFIRQYQREPVVVKKKQILTYLTK